MFANAGRLISFGRLCQVLALSLLLGCAIVTGTSSSDEGGVADGAGVRDDCSDAITTLRDELEREKENSLRKLEEISASLSTCEATTAELRQQAQASVKTAKTMQAQLEKERSMRSGSVQQLDAALNDLDDLRAAWLPFWATQRVEAVRVAAAPKARQLAGAAETYGTQAAAFWRQQGSPAVQKMKKQGWQGVRDVSTVVLRHGGKAWNRAYAKVPKKYAKHIDMAVVEARRAWPPLVSAAKRAFRIGREKFVLAVDEIAMLVEQSSMAPQIAKEASHVVALLVVSLPLTLLVPALARRRTASQKQKQKQKQTQQTNGTQQGTKVSNKKRH